jgi:hypothetical protein
MLAVSINALLLVVLPLVWLVALVLRSPRSWVVRVVSVAGCVLYIVFMLVAGAGWGIVGWYTRSALALLAAPLGVLAALRARDVRALPSGVGGWVSAATSLAALVLVGSGFLELRQRSAAPSAVPLENPLGAGVYLVQQGGDNGVLNGHHEVTAQRYALDVVGLNGAGFRASRLAAAQLEEYAIYAAPVHAPCAGEVLVARDGLADMPVGPPSEAGRATPLGNTVLIHCESDITVVLAHLKPHSVRVTAGERVHAGDALGAVGNSGNTTEPHLHLHAVRGRVADAARAIRDAEPVPLRIDGRVPVRNDRWVVHTS